MAARISARPNDETRATLERIQAQTGKSVTQRITEALDLYDQKLRNRVAGGKPGLLSLAALRRPASLSSGEDDSPRVDDSLGLVTRFLVGDTGGTLSTA